MNAVIIRHVAFEGPGLLASLLQRAGHQCTILDAAFNRLGDAGNATILVIMGGPISVNDNRFPVLGAEQEIVKYRIERKLPTLGICLGAQIIASALGANVSAMSGPEIGWSRLTLCETEVRNPLRHLQSPVLHWHGEMFDLPEGCESLASTDICPNQAFSIEDHTLALQFHPEIPEARHLEQWYMGHINELDLHHIDISQLRADAADHAQELRTNCSLMFNEWLARAAIHGSQGA